MQLKFHGGAREVGRSCVEIATGSKRLLLDCGLMITPEGSKYPVGFDFVEDIDAVFISHAHLDHTGALPLLDHRGMNCPIFTTKTTRLITRLLLRDAFKIGKISHHHLGYDELDIKKVLNCMRYVKIDTKGSFDSVNYEFFDAGHIPGSASVFLDVEGTTFLYTGDINTIPTHLQDPAETDFPEIDVMICESTYGDREHPRRDKTETEFIESIKEVLARGGTPIIPVFAVGRAAEILLILSKQKFNVPVFLDGMSVEATRLSLENPNDVKDHKALAAAFRKARLIKKRGDRDLAIKKQSIIVTTSGMLTGGPVMHYMKYLAHDPNNAILMTGYQGEDTNGRLLLGTGSLFIDGNRTKVLAEVKQFDFSAHAGLTGLKHLVRKVNPKKVFFIHGEEQSVDNLNEWASALGMESYAPKVGDIIEL
jgi:putative mRNA 3-end processing factor